MKIRTHISFFAFAFVACAISSTTTIFGMDTTKGKLCFGVNNSRKIESYNSFNMNYYVEPNKFVGKDIATVLPLSGADRTRIIEAFEKARETQQVVTTQYSLEGHNYTTEIVPMQKTSTTNYFVTVREKVTLEKQ